jgi:hypothetical protein
MCRDQKSVGENLNKMLDARCNVLEFQNIHFGYNLCVCSVRLIYITAICTKSLNM